MIAFHSPLVLNLIKFVQLTLIHDQDEEKERLYMCSESVSLIVTDCPEKGHAFVSKPLRFVVNHTPNFVCI
jgi:hypothetical protein